MIAAASVYSAGRGLRRICDLLHDRSPRSAQTIGPFIAATGEASDAECEPRSWAQAAGTSIRTSSTRLVITARPIVVNVSVWAVAIDTQGQF